MKCRSVVGLWPASLPSHRPVAAAAVAADLDALAALYTGGSDGSIVWWSSLSDGEIYPTALLCGHTAPISFISPCPSVPSDYSPSLLTASADGILCLWIRTSGRCIRRRRLYTLAPSTFALLPSSPLQVCITGLSRYSSATVAVVIDWHSLNAVQTVFHGGLTVSRPVKSIVVEHSNKNLSLILVDEFGRSQSLEISGDLGDKGGDVSLERSSSCEVLAPSLEEGSSQAVLSVAIGPRGDILAIVFEGHCEFRSACNGVLVGVMPKDTFFEQYLSGGMFLVYNIGVHDGSVASNFIVWCTNGAALVYEVFFSGSSFRFDIACRIPEIDNGHNSEVSFQFCYLTHHIFRIECSYGLVGESLVWKPSVTMWSLIQFQSEFLLGGSGDRLCLKVGEGGYHIDLVGRYSSHIQSERNDSTKEIYPDKHLGSCNDFKSGNEVDRKGQSVSSSVILNEDFYAPHSVVYGFCDGHIEVVHLLDILPKFDVSSCWFHGVVHPRISDLFLEGHTDAVLCLAAHTITTSVGKESLHRALVSGSADCTVRIWNLDTGSPVWVMHHHVAPVKQIVLPPPSAGRPWKDCFLSVGEDGCVALAALETLAVERIFPGHPGCPSVVVWDSIRGYVACLCESSSGLSDTRSVLYIWDVKTGARERIICGPASHSMFDHFCKEISKESQTGIIFSDSMSRLSLLSVIDDDSSFPYYGTITEKSQRNTNPTEAGSSLPQSRNRRVPLRSQNHDSYNVEETNLQFYQKGELAVRSSCPFAGIASLTVDLSGLMSLRSFQKGDKDARSDSSDGKTNDLKASDAANYTGVDSLEVSLLRFSLCLLHLWDADIELDKLLTEEMNVFKPKRLFVTPGLLGDRDSLTLMFPGMHSSLQLWKSSSEYCAMRSLTIVSIAQRLIRLSNSSKATSALAAFYTRNFAENLPDIKPPSLQLLVSFWQDSSEHVRMSARSLFHCAAPRAIPHALSLKRLFNTEAYLPPPIDFVEGANSESSSETNKSIDNLYNDELQKSYIISWLNSFEDSEWISCIGGTNQDAMCSHIVVASALAVWYPSKVKDELAKMVAGRLVKLAMSMNENYSSTAAEILAEGISTTWKAYLGPEIPHLLEDVFFQIEYISGPSNGFQNPALAISIREALVEILLPSLAMAEISVFLNAIEGQIWATSSDSPIHLVSLKSLIRMARGAPKPLAPYLDKVINYVFHTIDHGNSVMRKACLTSALITLREFARVFPMVSLNEAATRLAIGDAIGDIKSIKIRVYDLESVTLIKVLDASGPPGHPSLLGTSDTRIATAITALCFSSDGEGIVAFSENGLIIRWWSLGSAWWEKLSRSLVPVQCTKLIYVPPWEGFSPNSSRTSIMASTSGEKRFNSTQEKAKDMDDSEHLNLLLHNLDLSYRLRCVDGRKVILTRHGSELGTFLL